MSRKAHLGSFDPLASGKPSSSTQSPPSMASSMSATSGLNPVQMREFQQQQMHHMQQQGFPSGLIQAFASLRDKFPLRIWILDNSESMNLRDSHRIGGTFDNIHDSPVTRWEELNDCVVYHAQMAAQYQMRTRFALLNPPPSQVGPQYFAVGETGPVGLYQEMQTAQQVMINSRPGGPTLLTEQLAGLQKYIVSIAPQLRQQGKTATIVLATQGRPTGPNAQHFVSTLRSLEGLPVWVVIRLCTDDENVFDFYNSLDAHTELPFDVLDDFFGESLEVYLRNPWLTYGLPLHRFREMGFRSDVLDAIDERALTLPEVSALCRLLFAIPSLPNPVDNWTSFMHAIAGLIEREKQPWNPVSRKVTPWIDLHDLNRIYGAAAAPRPPPVSFPLRPPGAAIPQTYPQSTPHGYAQPMAPPPPAQTVPPRQAAAYTEAADVTRQPAQSMPPQPQPPKPPAVTHAAPPPENKKPEDEISELKRGILTQWALQPPKYQTPRPIHYLLGTMDSTFPPAFGVEKHDYFHKWKPFSLDALSSGEQAVIKRAVRKCKFFLHPDKLPRDFTEKQKFLCSILWDVTSDAWETNPE